MQTAWAVPVSPRWLLLLVASTGSKHLNGDNVYFMLFAPLLISPVAIADASFRAGA